MSKLPVVSEQIGRTTSEELTDELGIDYIERALQQIREENPFLASFISQFSSIEPYRHAGSKVAYCGLLVYKMLRNQSEADELKEKLRL